MAGHLVEMVAVLGLLDQLARLIQVVLELVTTKPRIPHFLE
jgi:hypothetical protein